MLSGMLAALSACEEAAAPEHEAREAAAESTVQAVRSALVNGGTWIPLGPAPISTGIGYDADFSSISHTGGQTSTGPAAGRAVVIAVNPLNPQDVFLGTAGGGLWNSRDSSTWPWRPLTDSAPSLAIGALALADCSADRCDTVYVGTGERNMRRQTQYGAGLFVGKFSAGGEFPINDYVFSEVPGSSAAFRFGAITGIVRSSATLIYAAVSLNNSVTSAHANVRAPTPTAGYGVHRWNGSAWSRVLSTPTTSATNWADVRVPTDLEADPVNPGGLIAGFSAEGLFRSAPGDDTNWCAMNPGATLSTRTCVGSGLPAAGTFDHVELATLPGSSTMYAMFGNCPSSTVPDHQGATLDPCVSPIFRTDNGGASWLQVQSGTVPTSGVPREGYSRYTHALKIHPSNAQTVYYSGLKPWRSTNGGVTWTQLTPAQLHGDQQDIVIIPGAGAAGADLLYSASDGGFFFSTDGGLTSWTSGNDNLLISQVHGLGIDLVDENLSDEFPASTAVIAGLQDNATAVFNGGRSWQSVNGGDGGEAVIQTPTINYTCAQRDAVRRTNGTRASGAAGKKVGTTKDFSLMPIYTQHEASKRVFHATDVVSFVAGDDASWAAGTSPTPVQLSPVFDETAGVHPAIETDRNIISSLGVAPSVAFRLYAGMYEGQLWRTTSATGTQPCATKTGTQPDCWARADNGLPTGWPISSVAVHPSDPNTLWLTISGFHVQTVWFSSNAGQTWTARSGGLPRTNLPR